MKAYQVKKGYCIRLASSQRFFTVKTIVLKFPLVQGNRSKIPSKVKFTTVCCRHVPEVDATHEVILSPGLKFRLGLIETFPIRNDDK